MGLVDAIWHLLNLIGPAAGMALIAPTLAKVLWRRDLRSVAWRGLVGWTFATGVLVLLAGLVVLGRDGRMATYGALVLVAAAVLWWRGWRR